MCRPRDYHTKECESEIQRPMSYDITYMWTLQYKLIYIIEINSCIETEGWNGDLGLADVNYYIQNG